MLPLATRRARRQLRREPGGDEQLQPERELVCERRVARPVLKQAQLVAEQVKHLGMRVAGFEHPRHRITGARRGVQRASVVAQVRVGIDRVRARDRQQVAAAFVELQVDVAEGLQPAAEATARAPHAFGDRADSPPHRGIEVQNAIRFAVAQRAQHNRLAT
jgi:hypothetical protein